MAAAVVVVRAMMRSLAMVVMIRLKVVLTIIFFLAVVGITP